MNYFLRHTLIRIMQDSIINKRPSSRYCTFLARNLLTYRRKKQNVVARFSEDSEFKNMTQRVYELLLKMILEDLKIHLDGPVRLYCDKKSEISISHNLIQQNKITHIEVDRQFIQKNSDNGLTFTLYISALLQLTDVLSKEFRNPKFLTIIAKMRIDNIYSSA